MRFTVGSAIKQFEATLLDPAELEHPNLELGPHGGIVVALGVALGTNTRNPDHPNAMMRIGFATVRPTVIPLVAR
jgi:hypothetical protein